MHWNGFGNYLRIFEDKVFLQSIKNCFFLFDYTSSNYADSWNDIGSFIK